MAQQQEDISGKIVATHKLLLQKPILLCGKGTRQALRRTRNILAPYHLDPA